ncbi:restriction endonuclease subunit S [Levilactobacillus brevis]|uniref:restriction endonuclease subunit S n=4 Tax=Lactobacillales TaxID=186826 RepID=UPI00325B2956
MKDNQAKYPQLRFKGFTDPWEQRKLGNLGLNISDGDWIEKQHIFENGQYRIIQTGNIGVDEYLDKPQNAKYFRQEDFNQLKANEIFPGDIVVCRLADPAGRAVILPNIGKQMVTSVDVAILRPSSRISFRFLVSQLNNPRNLKQVQIMASGSTRTRISRKNLEREIIQLPNINEQKKIGSFFSILNSTIALHQRKLAKLKELKQGYLQKLFPQNGSKFPQFRFAGFADDWEERKLGEVATLSSSKRIHLSDYVTEGIPFYRGSEISTGGITGNQELFISQEKFDEIKEKYGVPSEGDILVTAVGTLGNLWKVDSRRFYYKDGNLIQISKMQVNSDYLLTYFTGGIGKKRLLDSAAGSNQKALTMVKMREITVDFPSEDEQKKIGAFFKQLDNTIALHQRKLEKLQELKKGYLQKMFC